MSITLATSNGTASAGTDYAAVNQVINFANGDLADKTVSIPIHDSSSEEPKPSISL